MHKQWVEDVFNRDLDWENGMCLAEDVLRDAFINREYGLIVRKREKHSIIFVLSGLKVDSSNNKFKKILSTSFEQLNLMCDESATKSKQSTGKRKTAAKDRSGNATKLKRIETTIVNEEKDLPNESAKRNSIVSASGIKKKSRTK